MRRQHRHRPSQYYNRHSPYQRFRPLIGLLIVLVLVYVVGSWFVGLFGFSQTRNSAVALSPEPRGVVRVSIEGGEWKRADQAIKLYPEDRVNTGANGNAALTFFDGTFIRLQEDTSVQIIESTDKQEDSQLTLHVESGGIWIAVPTQRAYSGAITRLITTGILSVTLPTKTEALLSQRSMSVFDGDGIGATVHVTGSKEPIFIGEGQSFTVPEGPVGSGDDLYTYRKALDPRTVAAPFLESSREQYSSHWENDAPSDVVADVGEGDSMNDGSILTVLEPEDEITVESASIDVSGNVNPDIVSAVQINGYAAPIEPSGSFSLEIALPDEDEATITIVAQDEDGITIAEATRTVLRDREPPESPRFLTPAKDGETYQTQEKRFEITGEAPDDAIGIIVNDYRLQFFSPGDKTWKYLASTDLDNLQPGTNTFTAVAIDAGGYKSDPVMMKIFLGGETEGVIARDETVTDDNAEDTPIEEEDVIEPESLPNNAPLMPGTIKVTAPTPGAIHEARGTETIEFLLEGTVPSGTASVWVNGYQLRLYESGKDYWNYIASTKLGTMLRGKNEYEIVARNSSNEILDRFTYIIDFDPRG